MRARIALGSLALIAGASALALEANADVFVSDPLTEPTHPGRGSKGGTFSASGWTTTNSPTDSSQDAIWYEVAEALPTGAVQFTVTGMAVGASLAGTDHDILAIYQAPDGQPEPVVYSPYFRNNDFKVFTRIFGTKEIERPGAMKLEFAFCPRGQPWYHDDACSEACNQGGLAYANGEPKDIGWDAATAYTIRVEWTPGLISFFRNGTKLGDVSFTSIYAPKPMRVRLGSPRHDGIYPGEAYMPPGLTFRDLLVEGTPGEMTPVCGAGPADAGSDAATTPDGGGQLVEHAVLQDVTGASWEAGVFPVIEDLNVEAGPSGEPAAVVYLRFPPIAGSVEKAILRVRAGADASSAGGSGVVCRVEDDSWQETTLTWASRPPVSTTCAGSPRSVDPDTEIEWDVTSLIAGSGGGNVNLAIVSTDPDGAHYLSKEAGGGSTGPRLIVTTSAGPGAGGSSGSSAWPDSGASGGSAGSSRGSTDGEDSGCGCRTGAVPDAPPGAVLFALALLALWRRRFRSSE